MGITAERLLSLKLIDSVVPEPLGGAHRNHDEMARLLKKALVSALRPLQTMPVDGLLVRRRERLQAYGQFQELAI